MRNFGDFTLRLAFALALVFGFGLEAHAQTCSTAPGGLVSWYKAEDTALDRNGGLNGTPQNGATYANGKVGRAFSFDGNDDRVFVPHNAAQNVANITAEAWVFPTAFVGQGSIINKRTAVTNAGYTLEPTNSGTIAFIIYIGGISTVAVSPSPLPLNTWTHVAGTFDGTAVRVFVNGVQVASQPVAGSIDATTGDLVIGENIVNGSNWTGLIDEPSIYNRALSASELLAIFNAGTAGKCVAPSPSAVGLMSWWSGDNNAFDARSQVNGTVQGNVTFGAGKVGQTFQLGGNGDLSGNGDRVIVGNPINFQRQNFTIEGWIKRSSSAIVTNSPFPGVAGGTFFAYGQNGYGFLIDQTTNRLALTNVGNSVVFSTQTVTDTNWHHVAVTKAGTQTTFYVDGVADSPVTYNTNFTFTSNAAIGARGDSNALNAFFGAIDELAIYDQPLSASQIQAIVNAGSVGKAKPTATDVRNGLVGWWSADGTSNDIFGTNEGTLLNGGGYAAGKVSQAFTFDGIDDLVQIPDAAAINFASNAPLSIEMWVYRTSFAPIQHFIGKRTGCSASGIEYQMAFNEAANQGLVFGGSNGEVHSGVNLPLNTWTHLAGTFDGSTFRLYMNGALIGSVAGSNGAVNASPLVIGNSNSCGAFGGKIDDLALYNRALSTDEIASIVNAGAAGKLKEFGVGLGRPGISKTTPNFLGGGTFTTGGDASISLGTLLSSGAIQQIPLDLSTFPALPGGSTSLGLNYEIATDMTYTGPPSVCFNVPSVTDSAAFNRLRILHFESNSWQNRTNPGSRNFATKTICTNALTSLSPFAVVDSVVPTAAGVSLGGRVVTPKGQPISRVSVTIQNAQTGEIKRVTTNSFGNFNIDELRAGDFYILTFNRKGYQFAPAQQGIQLDDNLGDLTITAVSDN